MNARQRGGTRAHRSLAIALVAVAGACSRRPAPTPPSTEPSVPLRAPRTPPVATSPSTPPPSDPPALPPSTYPAPPRLVAIGDVHGDLDAFRSVLRLAGAIGADDHWSGGSLWIVQTGDLLDRGEQERGILDLATRLENEATHAGGRFIVLNGNHEIMNAQGDFRYVTANGFRDFDRYADDARGHVREEFPSTMQGRAAVFAPGGRYAREFAARNTVVVVGDTVFVHGGLIPAHIDTGLDAINNAARAFFLGRAPLAPILQSEDSPVWFRGYSLGEDPAACAQLDATLDRLHVRRMVVGHTVQRTGINAACANHVWRIDVGLARLYDGPIEALEITGATVRVLHGAR